MKMKSILLVAVLMLFVFNSCADSKDSYIKKFDKFIENVKNDCSNYTEVDWEKADKTFKDLTDTQYQKFRAELSEDDLITVTKLKASYVSLQLKRGAATVKKEVKKAVKEGGEAINKLLDDIKKE